MRFQLEPLLAEKELRDLVSALNDPATPFSDGASTAGWHARGLKRNHQLDRASPLHQQVSTRLEAVLTAQPLLQAAACPRRIHGLLFSRSGEGYGRHADQRLDAGRPQRPLVHCVSERTRGLQRCCPGAGEPRGRGELPPAGGRRDRSVVAIFR